MYKSKWYTLYTGKSSVLHGVVRTRLRNNTKTLFHVKLISVFSFPCPLPSPPNADDHA